MAQFNFKAIGTTWKIDIFQPIILHDESDLLSRIMARIDIFDKAYSRFREDSIVTQMSKESGFYTLPSDADRMLSLYHDLYLRTNGFVTPLVGNLLSDAGYDAQYSLKQKGKLEIPPAWDEVLEYKSDPEKPVLIIKKPVMLDFGAAGKGYLIDLVGQVLESNGVFSYCINAGGDILYKNPPVNGGGGTAKVADSAPLRVGLENPDNFEQVIGVCELKQGSICGSAGNRRVWGDFNHIMNPKTLTSAKDIVAVWVVADTALLADALTTCLFFVPASTLIDAYKFEYVLVRSDHSVEKSAGFPGEVFVG